MKQLATIAIVVVLLIGTAVYFKTKSPDNEPIAEPTVETPEEIVKVVAKPVDRGESAGTLTLKTALSNGYLLQGPQNLYAKIDVEATKVRPNTRSPLNISVVIDRSGSMRGQKMSNAKSAAKELLRRLQNTDRMSIVSYSGNARVEYNSQRLTPSNRAAMIRAIDGIRPNGATNVSGGFNEALHQVKKWKTPNAVNRIILISDGRPTAGLKGNRLVNLSKSARDLNVSVSTIGVGLDYNENLMTALAKEGSGNYYFVDQPHQIQGFLVREVTALSSIVARRTNLVITLADGVNVQSVEGFPHTRNGPLLTIPLSEFAADEHKNILLQMTTDAKTMGEKPILNVQLSYQDEVNQKPQLQTLALKSVVTNQAALALTGRNVDVVERIQQVELASEVTAAMDLWESGDAAGAKKVLTRSKKKLNKRRREFKFADDAAYGRAASGLADMESKLDSAPAASPKAKRERKKAKSLGFEIMNDARAF